MNGFSGNPENTSAQERDCEALPLDADLRANIRLLSFDLWLTLIRSHPEFKRRRNARMRVLLRSRLAPAAFDRRVREADRHADRMAEMRGRDIDFRERVMRLAQAVGCPKPAAATLARLRAEQAALLEAFPPCLIDPATPHHLATLKQRGYGIGLISNTGYLHGDLLRKVLARLGIGAYFDHMLFSDEVGMAKPHPRIFRRMLALTRIDPAHVLHVGDNLRADVAGARRIGMHALHAQDDTLGKIVNLMTGRAIMNERDAAA